jgi:hypothetical protein
LKQLVGKIKFILQSEQQYKERSDTLNKALKLLKVRIAEIEK